MNIKNQVLESQESERTNQVLESQESERTNQILDEINSLNKQINEMPLHNPVLVRQNAQIISCIEIYQKKYPN